MLIPTFRYKGASTTKDKEPPYDEHHILISGEVLLRVIADKHCMNIIKSTICSPRSAIELANNHRIPVNSVYRKLRFLVKNRILRVSAIISNDGRKVFYYQSRIGEITIQRICSSLEIEVIPNNSIENVNHKSNIACPVCEILFGSKQNHELVNIETNHTNNLQD